MGANVKDVAYEQTKSCLIEYLHYNYNNIWVLFIMIIYINKLPRILNPCQGNQSGDFDSDILVTQNLLFLNVLSHTKLIWEIHNMVRLTHDKS